MLWINFYCKKKQFNSKPQKKLENIFQKYTITLGFNWSCMPSIWIRTKKGIKVNKLALDYFKEYNI